MKHKKEKEKKQDSGDRNVDLTKLKELVLSPDSNSIKSPTTITAETKLGSKSMDHIQRQREQQIANDPYFLSNEFMAKMTAIKRDREIAAAEALIAWEHNNSIVQAERRSQEKASAIKHLQEYYSNNPSAKAAKLEEDKIKQQEHLDILNKLARQKSRQIESLVVWFEKPFYTYNTTTLEASPAAKIISARKFASDRFGHERFSYRSIPAGYSQPESLSLRTIEENIHQDRLRSEKALLDIIDSEHTNRVNKLKADWENAEDLDVRNAKLDSDIKNISKLKTRVTQN